MSEHCNALRASLSLRIEQLDDFRAAARADRFVEPARALLDRRGNRCAGSASLHSCEWSVREAGQVRAADDSQSVFLWEGEAPAELLLGSDRLLGDRAIV